jgi:GAF domain-containing protein
MKTTLLDQIDKNAIVQDDWRESFLQRILVIAAIGGIVALVPGIFTTDNLFLQGSYIGVFVVLVTTIVVRPPYFIKAGLFVTLPLILGISSMLNAGIRGDSLFFLLAFVTFSALLIGPQGGLIAIGVSEIVVIGMGYLVLNGYFTLLDSLSTEGSLDNWITDSILLLLISLVMMSGLRVLQDGFQRIQEQNKIMVDALQKSQLELEDRVAERTKELARKTNQLNASTFVAHQVASIQDLNALLNSTVNLISKQFGYYHVAIYLINLRGDYATLQAASSEGGKRLAERGYRLRVGVEGIVGFVAGEKKPRMALDVGEDAFFFDSSDLPDTRSELALPLIVRNQVIGVLDMQSTDVQAFQYDEIDMFQTLVDQIAVAIENVRLISESELTISQLEVISTENTRRNWQAESSVRKPAFQYSATGVQPIESSNPPKDKNVLNVPLMLRGQKIGKITLHRKEGFQNWTTQEKSVAIEVANQTALALENIRLVENTRQRANREKAISNISARIRETLDLDTVLRTSAREIQNALNLQEAEVRLIPQDDPNDEKESQEARPS